MTGYMAQLRMTEAEAARDFFAVLARVRDGAEVVVERDHHPVAVITAPAESTTVMRYRTIDEAIAIAEAFEARLGYAPVPDPDFASDVQEAINAHREPLDPPAWD
jgi:antitoxin (DNA-binding transcriptional repressor) of toxin-antitoxin stability system